MEFLLSRPKSFVSHYKYVGPQNNHGKSMVKNMYEVKLLLFFALDIGFSKLQVFGSIIKIGTLGYSNIFNQK